MLIYKELLAVWRDKKSRSILIVPPIIQLIIFSFAVTLDVNHASIGILNLDEGHEAVELIERFKGSPMFNKITFLKSVDEISPFIDEQRGVMILSIDQQFSRLLKAKKAAKVQLILDGRKSNTAQIVAGYATSILDSLNISYANREGIKLQNARIVERNWFNPNLNYYWFTVPNLSGVLTMLIGLVLTGLSVARERELGTFEQLMVSPITPFEIMLGKMIPSVIIGLLEGSVIITAALLIFQIPMEGSFLLLYFSMFVFMCSIIGIGLFISSMCSTQQQAIVGAYVFMSPAVLLSGFATPIENMPDWLQTLTYLNPLRYYLIIAKGIFLKAMPFWTVMHYIWPMALIAVVNLSLAAWFFKKRLQ
jgi:ABC-2 type transport system permease protein